MGISRKSFEAMQARLNGRGRPDTVEANALDFARIVGVDPSLRRTGLAALDVRAQPKALGFEAIACQVSWPRSRCLGEIASQVRAFMEAQRPDACVFEGLFFAQNLKTALIMGEARGAALSVVASMGVPVFEVAPRKVKKAVTGQGGASKQTVARMTGQFLGLETLPGPDETDALAIALAFHFEANQGLLREANPI